MKYMGLILAVGLVVTGKAHALHGDYKVVNVGTELPSEGLRKTTLTVQVGGDSFDRFQITRIRQTGFRHLGDPPVMLLPIVSFPGEYWELTTEGYADSFGPQLALEGYDVWLVGNRVAAAQPGECESGAVDCSAMAGWDQDAAVDDVMFARWLVALAHPWKRPALMGAGAGASTATATVNAHPYLFEGLVLLEGSMYSSDPDVRARNAAFCQLDQARLDAGEYIDPSLGTLKLLVDLAAVAPNDPTPVPLFPPGTTNLQALLFVFTQPDPSNPLNFTDEFIRLAGDPFSGTLFYSDLERLYGLSPMISGYAPVAFARDTHCAIGEGISRFTDNLDAFGGDVLVIAAGRGFGQMVTDTADLMTSANVAVSFTPEYGESDHYLNQDWRHETLAPVVSWLSTVF